MNETKLIISNKKVRVELPPAAGAEGEKALVYNPATKQLGLGNTGADSTPFNGNRPILAPIPGLQGKVLGGTTTGNVLKNLLNALYPAQPPAVDLIITDSSREFGAPVAVNLYYNVEPGTNPITSIQVGSVTVDADELQGVRQTQTLPNTNTTFTLTASDGVLSASDSVTVTYSHNRFWFQSEANLLGLGDAELSSLLQGTTSKELAGSRQQSRTFNLNSEYVYFAYPASFGPASFIVGGLPNTAYQAYPFTYTNALGYQEPYILYRSGGRGTGTISITLN